VQLRKGADQKTKYELTSGGWGFRVGACLGLGVVRADLAVPGTRLEVEIFGTRGEPRRKWKSR
jgi:dimethylglycine dehydrogenase